MLTGVVDGRRHSKCESGSAPSETKYRATLVTWGTYVTGALVVITFHVVNVGIAERISYRRPQMAEKAHQ